MLLLLAVTRQAKLQAVREAASKAAKQQDDLKAKREVIEWRIEQLKSSRKTTESQLTEFRLALGHVEEHARRFADRLDQLEAARRDHDRQTAPAKLQRAALESELQHVRGEIASAERRVADIKQQIEKRPHCYAIIPYEGPNQTHRRPIYLECLADAVVLQPEGIRFGEADFDGQLDAGNPLAAALRAVREYLTDRAGYDPRIHGEPYPLLLVRPRGILAFYAARGALQWWESDFGYELIGDDWNLQFPPPDPQLVKAIGQELELARADGDGSPPPHQTHGLLPPC